ncbi:MAG: GspH/FimT family pseudopilin, partial [Wenzhouxiangellaceae bacterium]
MRTRISGLTLIELMLALSLSAVITSLAMPSMLDFMQRQRISATANELVAHINLARMHAVYQRELAVLCPSNNQVDCTGGNRWDSGWIVFRDPDNNGQPDTPSDLLRVRQSVSNLVLDSAGRSRVRYQVDGTAGGSNLTIKLCDPH